MCDYSLHHLASRPAHVGDKLVTTKFGRTFTRGFCAIDQRGVAVCLQPGTELAFDREVQSEPSFRLFPARKLGASVARFRHVNEGKPYMHHDALELPSGQVVLLTALCEGQRATVIQLPATERLVVREDAPATVA
jgi:hypothetical protein